MVKASLRPHDRRANRKGGEMGRGSKKWRYEKVDPALSRSTTAGVLFIYFFP